MQYELWDHQKEGAKRAYQAGSFGFFFEMGTGKTLVTITTLRYKYNDAGRLLPTLILCPPIVIENWKREFAKFSKINPKDIVCLTGSGKKRLEIFQRKMESKRGFIAITNYESLLMEPLFKAFGVWHPTIMVLDESHKCKDQKAKRTKRAIELADSGIKHCYLLTGTPILNSPTDIFSQFRIMDKGDTFGTNFWKFRSKYFYDKNAGMPPTKYFPNWVVAPGSLDKLNILVGAKSMTVKKDECLTLPPLVRQEIYVELSPKQEKAYQEMKTHFLTFVDGKAAKANIALTKLLKLQQIISGFIPVLDEDEKQVVKTVNIPFELKHNPRAQALMELLQEITPHEKVIVWAVFRENYKLIREVCDEIKVPFVEVHGSIPDKKKMEAVDRFNDDPTTRVFIGHPGSGGIGINLVSASYSIFYSRGYSLEYDLQAEARNHRGGSEIHKKVTRIDLVAKDTVDEIITKKLQEKQRISDAILLDIIEELKNE